MKLINKEALVTEIEKLRKNAWESFQKGNSTEEQYYLRYGEIQDILSFLDTLEMKEVDTEQLDKLLDWWKEVTTDYSAYKVKEVDLDYIKDELDRVVKIYKPDGDFGWGTLYNIATHFFELGLKAQKGE